MGKKYYINSISRYSLWKECFCFLLEKSQEFKIVFENDTECDSESFLAIGRDEFISLPRIDIKDYDGMEGCIEISGKIDVNVKKLFIKYISPSFDGNCQDLWSFKLIFDDKSKLSICDFSECFLELDENEIEQLTLLGVDFDLIKCVSEAEIKNDIKVVQFQLSKSEFDDIANDLSKTFDNN